MKKLIVVCLVLACISVASFRTSSAQVSKTSKLGKYIEMSPETLSNKIKGGWAGQMIGVAYGGPTEFQYNGTMIQDYIPLNWNNNSINWYYDNFPGLFDDVYMDVTFVNMFEKYGLDVHVDSLAMAFARADYLLWHANQAARFNILRGIMPPASGHWMNNPHADDIDYQIEADYAGLMAPAMINTASEISDRVGHIMNYGDGWYGGVFVGAMYTQAFASDNIAWIVEQALSVIPRQSVFYRCVNSVIDQWKDDPSDWKKAWFNLERDWSSDLYCPDGVYVPFNIDAAINSAYVVVGLLYGDGDFTKTMDIATRCGQDSDCNPATAAGILGAIYGYDRIPQKYIAALKKVEQRELIHTGCNLEQVYKMSIKHAHEVICRNGGEVSSGNIKIRYQNPVPVPLEISFDGLRPIKKEVIRKTLDDSLKYEFDGNGLVIRGKVDGPAGYIAEVEFYIDGKLIEVSRMPQNYNTRKHEIFWNYQLTNSVHVLTCRWNNPHKDAKIYLDDAIWYRKSK